MVFKNQGSILYLFGYLVYIWSQPSPGKLFLGLIFLALISFGFYPLAYLFCRNLKNPAARKFKEQLATAAESAGGFFTLLFALTFIPKAHFIETHLALFGLLILTFLATRNILPGLKERHEEQETSDADRNSNVGLPINRF
jgi:hypothetical protein